MCALAVVSSGATRSADIAGTYRMTGTADISSPALNRTVDVHADVHLQPGRARHDVVVTISAEGASCGLAARLDDGGQLQFEPGQRCSAKPSSSGVRGHIDGTLRSAHGRITGERLELDLAFDVDGAVSIRSASRIEVLGEVVDLPSAWMPDIPVRGRAHAVAAGQRDHSRAAR